jgi:hypothetical protein
MIRLCGAESNLQTILALSRPYARGKECSKPGEAREGLRQFLTAVQPDVPRRAGALAYLTSGAEHEELLGIFDSGSSLDDTPYRFDGADDRAGGMQKLERIERALAALERIDPLSKAVFDLAMFTVFWAPCGIAGGGTTSQALGILWADPRPAWSERDLLEFLIHELTHTLVFLDEWRHPQFTSREALAERSNYALSAIRRTERPLDKTLHSIVVGTEVLLAREEALGHTSRDGLHPGSAELRSTIIESIASIRKVGARNDSLAARGWELLDRCDSALPASLGAPVGSA